MAKRTDPRLIQAMNALAQGQAHAAETLCRTVLAEHPKDHLAMALLAQVCNTVGQYEEGLQLIRNAIKKNSKRADYHGLLGDMLTTQGDFRSAIGAYDKALKIQPTHHGVLAGKANTWLRLNQPEKALKLLEPIIRKGNEDATISIVYAKALLECKMPDEAAQALLPHLPAKNESVETRRTLYFILGKAMEEAGEYGSAFEAYTEGNALSETSFDLEALVNTHNQIIELYPAESTESMQTSDINDASLVFIVGMLRSGSTLTEQILDAHPKGKGLGELEMLPLLLRDVEWSTVTEENLRAIANEYLEAIGNISNAPLRIDKQLGNYQNVGRIKQLFPNAKVIHCTRNPMSMGLSCYSQKLPPFTNGWASSLHRIGHFYNEYMRLMRHWNEVFGDSILTVSYEELVADQEGTTKRILEFCDLEFDPCCLEFWKTGRAVLTLSQDQVRKPMYDSSVARHERFGALLDPLRDALGV